MTEHNDETDNFDKRLDRLKKSVQETRNTRPFQKSGSPIPRTPLGEGLRMGIEMGVGVAVGGILGLTFDHWVGTSPWGMIVFFLLGAIGGMQNVLRSVRKSMQSDKKE